MERGSDAERMGRGPGNSLLLQTVVILAQRAQLWNLKYSNFIFVLRIYVIVLGVGSGVDKNMMEDSLTR